jgi:hypothetical protein
MLAFSLSARLPLEKDFFGSVIVSLRLTKITPGHGHLTGSTLRKVWGYQKRARQILIGAGANFDFKRNATLLPMSPPAGSNAVNDRVASAASNGKETAPLECTHVPEKVEAKLKVGDIFAFGSSIGVRPIGGIGASFMALPGWTHDGKENPPKIIHKRRPETMFEPWITLKIRSHTFVGSGFVSVSNTIIANGVEYVVSKLITMNLTSRRDGAEVSGHMRTRCRYA